MKRIMKKRFLILSIITFCISVLTIFLLSNNDNAKIEIAKEITNEIEETSNEVVENSTSNESENAENTQTTENVE